MYLLVHQSNSPAALRAGNRCPRFRFLGTQIVSCITGSLSFSSPYFWATRTNSSVQKEGAEELAVLIISCSVLAFDYFLGEKLLLLITLFGLTCSEHDCIKGTIVSLSGLVCRLRWYHSYVVVMSHFKTTSTRHLSRHHRNQQPSPDKTVPESRAYTHGPPLLTDDQRKENIISLTVVSEKNWSPRAQNFCRWSWKSKVLGEI